MNKKYFTVPEAAEYLSISESALRTMIARRQIEFLKLGERRIRFDIDILETAFIKYETVDQIINFGDPNNEC